MARFLESRGMVEDALEVATDPDYRFELAIQLGKLEIAQVLTADLSEQELSFVLFYASILRLCVFLFAPSKYDVL